MAHKTFISYKYSESEELRNKIIDALGEDAKYYNGENLSSDDMSGETIEKIKNVLKDMMYDTSVTIVILSPNMIQSNWIDWEIEYCLKSITRKDRTSHINGIVGVIKKCEGNYSWFKNEHPNLHGNIVSSYKLEKVYDIISKNHFNSEPVKWHCDKCKAYDPLEGSYISFIEEDVFLSDPIKYINNAYDKSESDALGYKITKEI